MNQATFIGNLTADAQQRTARDMVTTYVTFTVAVNRRLKDGTKSAEYVNCLYSGNAAGITPYLAKGKKIAVTGRVSCRAWVDQQGQPRASLELFARDVELCGGRDADAPAQPQPQTSYAPQAPAQPQPQTPYAPAPAPENDGLPF